MEVAPNARKMRAIGRRHDIVKTPTIARGTAFDIAVLFGNLWVAPRIADVAQDERAANPAFGCLLLISLLLYSLGAWLKREPLHARLATRASTPTPTWAWIALFVLMIMQSALFAGGFMLGAEQLAGGFLAHATIPGANVILPLGVGVALVAPTWLTIRALMPPRNSTGAPTPFARRELLADIAIYSTTMIALAWWNAMVVPELAQAHPRSGLVSALLILLATVPFAIFYAAPRILFLAEDYREISTWLRMAVAMAPLAARVIPT